MPKWIIDPLHSDVHFKTRYLLISTVTGEFKKFEGTLEASDDNFTDARITFSAETASVHTNNEKRDEDLRHEDFFDVTRHPKLHFVSHGFVHESGNKYALRGMLTIKGISRWIELDAVSGGKAQDADGKERIGFEVSGHLNRWDYGLMWSLLTESGAFILGENIRIHANVQLVKVN